MDEVVEMRKDILGKEHPRTLASITNRAIIYRDQGDLNTAISIMEQSLEIMKRTLGEYHSQTRYSQDLLLRMRS